MSLLKLGISFGIVALFSSAVMADDVRNVDAQLNCTGSRGNMNITVLLQSAGAATQISVGGAAFQLLNAQTPLRLVSEGGLYIQQVKNGSHNIILRSPDLGDVRAAQAGDRLNFQNLTGTLNLLGGGGEYAITCNGSITAR